MAPQGLIDLIESIEGEAPIFFGESFNEHFTTSKSFIKLTRPWVKPFRFEVEVEMAREVAALGVPVAHPRVDAPLSFIDENGKTRYVTIWERVFPVGPLTREQGTRIAAEWIKRLWSLPVPAAATEFTLADFTHAAHVRLDSNRHPHAPRVLELILEASEHPGYRSPGNNGLIHGDLHNDNLLLTADGILVIDWESACHGPLEWDAAQNLRYTPPALVAQQRNWWLTQGVDPELLDFYKHFRTLTSLSHLIASGIKNPIYFECLEALGLEPC